MTEKGLSGNALKVIAIVAFFIFHSPTYGLVHLACWLAVPLLAMYNGQRGRLKWLGKFFYYYYPVHMAVIGLLARCFQ